MEGEPEQKRRKNQRNGQMREEQWKMSSKNMSFLLEYSYF